MNDSGDGRLQGPSHHPSHADLRIFPTSSELRSLQSVYTPASSFPQYQPTANSACPSFDSPPRGPVPTAAATSTQCQQPMEMSHASLDRTTFSSRGATQLPNACVRTAPSPVLHDVPSEAADPTIKKKRRRADARQLEALNGMYARTPFPSTEERQQLARNLDMSARSVQIWLALTFVCIICELLTLLSGLRTKGKRAVKEDEIPPTLQSTRSL